LETGEEAFAVNISAVSGREISRLAASDLASIFLANRDATILAIRKTPHPLAISLSAVKRDDAGNGWDLMLDGSYTITDARAVLERFALDALSPESGLSRQMAESWLANTLKPKILDAVRDISITDIREKDALPVQWWVTQLNKWLVNAGLSGKVKAVHWKSADAARAAEDHAREQDMERIVKERDRQLQAEIREAKAKTDYEKEKGRIEADKKLSDSERTHQLQLLELHHRKELLAAETDIENARRAAEQAALEHEVTLARLQKDLEATRKAEVRMVEAQTQNTALEKVLAKANTVLEQLGRIGEPLLQQLVDRNSAKAHQAAERLVSPEFGFNPTQLAMLGFPVVKQSFVETLAKKQAADSQPVQLSKADLTTREVGAAKVPALPIGRPLKFRLVSRRSGYVALLNLGTSGAIYLHVPNAMIGVPNVRVTESKPYFVPGPELFPWEWDYREEGPAGWEHIVGIVSDEPIVPADVLGRSTAEAPIVRLTPEEVGALFAKLEDLPPETWSAGVLSFLVG
jgi:hypothetical protein